MPNYLQAMAGRLGRGMGRRGMGVDPRRRFAQKLMEQGVDTSPAHLGTGIGRLGKALAAAYMMRQSQGQEADAMEWLTAQQPERLRQPTEAEAFKASPDLRGLEIASDVQWGSGQDQVHPDGLEKDFFEGGGLKETTNWEGGLRHGENIEYNEDNSVKKTVMWDRGKEISRTGDKDKSPPDTDLLQFDKDFPPEASSEEDYKNLLSGADPEPEEVPQETSFPYGRRDYAQELASGMTAYQGAKANQISDPRTRMEWLRESYRTNPELKNNWFANRLIQNLMLNEIARDEGLGKEKSGRPAAGIQYFDRRQELVKKGATPEELAIFDSMVRKDMLINRGDKFEIRSGVNPQGSTPTTIQKELPLEKKIPYVKKVEEVKQKAKLDAKYMDDLTRMQPKAFSSLGSFQQKTNFMKDNIEQAIANISGWSTKFGAALSGWPGSQAQALDKILTTIKANVGFQALQEMRANSPTGGALGQVSERELAYLQATLGEIAQTQDGAILTQKLKDMQEQIEGMGERLQQAYDMTFAPLQGSSAIRPSTVPPIINNRRKEDDPMDLGL